MFFFLKDFTNSIYLFKLWQGGGGGRAKNSFQSILLILIACISGMVRETGGGQSKSKSKSNAKREKSSPELKSYITTGSHNPENETLWDASTGERLWDKESQ